MWNSPDNEELTELGCLGRSSCTKAHPKKAASWGQCSSLASCYWYIFWPMAKHRTGMSKWAIPLPRPQPVISATLKADTIQLLAAAWSLCCFVRPQRSANVVNLSQAHATQFQIEFRSAKIEHARWQEPSGCRDHDERLRVDVIPVEDPLEEALGSVALPKWIARTTGGRHSKQGTRLTSKHGNSVKVRDTSLSWDGG